MQEAYRKQEGAKSGVWMRPSRRVGAAVDGRRFISPPNGVDSGAIERPTDHSHEGWRPGIPFGAKPPGIRQGQAKGGSVDRCWLDGQRLMSP